MKEMHWRHMDMLAGMVEDASSYMDPRGWWGPSPPPPMFMNQGVRPNVSRFCLEIYFVLT